MALHENFVIVAMHIAAQKDGHVCYEWPTQCTLWRDPRVTRMITKFKMDMVKTTDACLD